jgi:c-di-GMP-binding flagellar brake protein YcgR
MKNNPANAERRNHTRFKAKAGAYTVFSARSIIPGRINDISLGGLCFSYVEGEEWYHESSELDILFGDDDFYLDKIPFETVSDTIIENESPYSQIIMRRCGVKFGKMSSEQLEQLKHFITQNTMNGAENQFNA